MFGGQKPEQPHPKSYKNLKNLIGFSFLINLCICGNK